MAYNPCQSWKSMRKIMKKLVTVKVFWINQKWNIWQLWGALGRTHLYCTTRLHRYLLSEHTHAGFVCAVMPTPPANAASDTSAQTWNYYMLWIASCKVCTVCTKFPNLIFSYSHFLYAKIKLVYLLFTEDIFKNVSKFWFRIRKKFPGNSEMAINTFLPFCTVFFCKVVFSVLAQPDY